MMTKWEDEMEWRWNDPAFRASVARLEQRANHILATMPREERARKAQAAAERIQAALERGRDRRRAHERLLQSAANHKAWMRSMDERWEAIFADIRSLMTDEQRFARAVERNTSPKEWQGYLTAMNAKASSQRTETT